MKRVDIINTIGREYLTANIENDEFSYKKAIDYRPLTNDEKHWKTDLRFEGKNLSILVETKKQKNTNFNKKIIEQVFAYIKLEKEFRRKNNIIAILYNETNDNIRVWKNNQELTDETTINSFQYYLSLFNKKENKKENVIETTNQLNNDLHSFGILEDQRSQFIGSLLVALNNGLEYNDWLKSNEILQRIKEILEAKIDNDENKKTKTDLLIRTLNKQNIRELKTNQWIYLLDKLKIELIPFIDSKSPQGEDLLNLFFTTFNKYVGKKDKNQAYTPTHITDFMCEISNINPKSRVLDPTCGSGSFLVQAMSKMIAKSGNNEKLKQDIKQKQLFGIEKEEKAFGLATTNMLIHEDGKTNVVLDSCFEREKWIKENNINAVLMNPPFNAQKMPHNCPKNKNKDMDSTKGFYFVNWVANIVNKGTLATILPLSCAIGSDSSIALYKKKMLENHTLKAVFSLPNDVFYPGAAVNVCIMLFDLGKPHNSNEKTFFGYYKDDGFTKKKNKGRVEKINWEITKTKWLKAYHNKESIAGLCIMKNVTAEDEWLAEAYMETDYSILTENNFIQTIRDFIAFKVKNGDINE